MQKRQLMIRPPSRRALLLVAALCLPVTACGSDNDPEDIADDDLEATSMVVGHTYKLSDGRLGVLTSLAGKSASVSAYDAKLKQLATVTVGKATLKGYVPFNAPAPNTNANASRRADVASFFDNSASEYPQLVGQIDKLEVVWKGVNWMNYNCVANSVRKTTWDEPKSTMEAQDAYYATYGLRPVVSGIITMTHLRPQKGLEKVLIYALRSNPGHPRHAVVQDADGLWNSKMGQGPHIKLVDAEMLVGSDAGIPMRLYARAR